MIERDRREGFVKERKRQKRKSKQVLLNETKLKIEGQVYISLLAHGDIYSRKNNERIYLSHFHFLVQSFKARNFTGCSKRGHSPDS